MKKQMIVNISAGKQNIKEWLEQQLVLSSRKLKALFKNKRIWINGKVAYSDNSVQNGDVIEIDLSEMGKDSTVPEDIPIEVVYEDAHMLAVNKKPGMLVHPTQTHTGGTLANAVKHYFLSKGLELPIRLVNRIDMDTSGLVLFAKSGEAHAALVKQLEQEDAYKLYLAIVQGSLENSKGLIDKPIGVDEENPIRRAVRVDGQKSVTEYEVVERLTDADLVKLRIITGRTHQIRVHMSDAGHPLLGDALYGGSQDKINRQALHAYQLRFTHPYEKRDIILQAELPEDMAQLLKELGR